MKTKHKLIDIPVYCPRCHMVRAKLEEKTLNIQCPSCGYLKAPKYELSTWKKLQKKLKYFRNRAATEIKLKNPIKKHYVTVYIVDQAYGGPEEGGWYYPTGEPQDHRLNTWFWTRGRAMDYYDKHIDEVRAMNEGRYPIDSVLSCGVFALHVEDEKPAPYPQGRPHYE